MFRMISSPGKQEVGVRLKAEATNLSLDAQTIADQLRAAFFGRLPVRVQRFRSRLLLTLSRTKELVRINRIDGIRIVTIQGDIDGRVGNTSAIVGDTLKRFVLELKKKYPGVRVGFEGQNKETEITQKSMASGFILGLIGVFSVTC